MLSIALAPVTTDDLPALFAHQNDPEARAMAAFAGRDWDAFLAHWTRLLSDPDVITRAIRADGRLAGHIGSWGQETRRHVGYWIDRTMWGKGIASAAVSAFLQVDRTRPLFAHVAAHNAASIRVLEKAGFVRLREETTPDGVREIILVLGAAGRSS